AARRSRRAWTWPAKRTSAAVATSTSTAAATSGAGERREREGKGRAFRMPRLGEACPARQSRTPSWSVDDGPTLLHHAHPHRPGFTLQVQANEIVSGGHAPAEVIAEIPGHDVRSRGDVARDQSAHRPPAHIDHSERHERGTRERVLQLRTRATRVGTPIPELERRDALRNLQGPASPYRISGDLRVRRSAGLQQES